MFNTLLKIQHFFEALYRSAVSLLRVLFRMRFLSGYSHIKAPSGSLIILANGPSLRSDLDRHRARLSSCNTMAVNMFALSDDFSIIKPGFYIMLDIAFFKEKTLPRIMEAREKVLDKFKNSLSWDMVLLMPAEARNSHFHRQLLNAGLPLQFAFFNRTVVDGLKAVRNFMYSRGWGMPPPQNVLIGAIMSAVHIGFKKIYLIGADHSWHEEIRIKDDGALEITDRHFYNPSGQKLTKHHGETLKQLKIHEFFHELSRTFRSHILIEEFARSKGVDIFNASSASYIDAYRKMSIEELQWDNLRAK